MRGQDAHSRRAGRPRYVQRSLKQGRCLGEKLFDDVAGNVRQPEVPALEFVG